MVDFEKFRVSFCECCDTNKKKRCCLGYIADNKSFIDWEAFMESHGGKEHDFKHCDAIYVQDDDTACFIEQKNLCWFVDENNKPKNAEVLADELTAKFSNSEIVFKQVYKKTVTTRKFCSYDTNNIKPSISVQNIIRQIRNTYVPYLDTKQILCDTCKNISNIVLYKAF